MRNAHRFPSTVEFINERSDIKSLLDPTNPHNKWSVRHSGFDTLFLPDGSGISRQFIRSVASLPKLLLSAGDPRNVDSHVGVHGERVHPHMVSKYDSFTAFRNMYHHEELQGIRNNLSVGPDVITSEIISLRDTDWHTHRGRVDGVPRESSLSFLCRKLADFLSRCESAAMIYNLLKPNFFPQWQF